MDTRSVKRAMCKASLQENAADNNDATKRGGPVPLYVEDGAGDLAPVSSGMREREEVTDNQQESKKPRITEGLGR